MKKGRSILLIHAFFLMLSLSNCGVAKKDYLQPAAYEKMLAIDNSLKGKDLLVYYFDGDCSFCIAKLITMEKENNKDGARRVYIAKTSDPVVFSFNIKENGVTAPVYIDNDNFFPAFLQLNRVARVNADRVISYEKDK